MDTLAGTDEVVIRLCNGSNVKSPISSPVDHEEERGIIASLPKFVPQIVQDITGLSIKCHLLDHNITYYCADQLELKFVFFTGVTEKDAKKTPTGHYVNIPDNLVIVSKEDLLNVVPF